MVSSATPKFGVRFLSRKERTVRRVTKCETREIQKRLEPPKLVRARPPPKPKAPKKQTVPATLCKPPKAPRVSASRANTRSEPTKTNTSSTTTSAGSSSTSFTAPSSSAPRTLQTEDLAKLSRLNCSREFSLFHQFIKAELSRSYENQLAFLQTKLQHLKNEFVNKQAEHLNFEQIRDYYNEAVQENLRRRIKPDEYLTLADTLKQDSKQAIDRWLRKKELKPQRQLTEFLQRRQARIRDRIKETLEEVKKQQQAEQETDEPNETESSITITTALTTTEVPIEPAAITTVEDEEDVMVID